eukprot:COSAG01_NODE_50940_length_359_cov_0.553846_1_plen_29_part_10
MRVTISKTRPYRYMKCFFATGGRCAMKYM